MTPYQCQFIDVATSVTLYQCCYISDTMQINVATSVTLHQWCNNNVILHTTSMSLHQWHVINVIYINDIILLLQLQCQYIITSWSGILHQCNLCKLQCNHINVDGIYDTSEIVHQWQFISKDAFISFHIRGHKAATRGYNKKQRAFPSTHTKYSNMHKSHLTTFFQCIRSLKYPKFPMHYDFQCSNVDISIL